MADAAGDDQELVRQLARGDQAAFNACYERYQGPIFRFAWHMSGNQTTAEEVTQEVFLRLIHKPKKFDAAKGTLAGYLFGIARNVMRRQMAASFLDVPLEDAELSENPAFAADSNVLWELDRQERLELLHRSVLALPAPYREALILCDLEEMSYPEAAAILDCPAGTVASRLHRARGHAEIARADREVRAMNPQRDTLSEALRELAATSPQASPELGARLQSEFTRHHVQRRRRRAAVVFGLAACLALGVYWLRPRGEVAKIKVVEPATQTAQAPPPAPKVARLRTPSFRHRSSQAQVQSREFIPAGTRTPVGLSYEGPRQA